MSLDPTSPTAKPVRYLRSRGRRRQEVLLLVESTAPRTYSSNSVPFILRSGRGLLLLFLLGLGLFLGLGGFFLFRILLFLTEENLVLLLSLQPCLLE